MDKSPIKAGELCFLTGCRISANCGRVVTTIRKYQNHGQWFWECESVTPIPTAEYWADGSYNITGRMERKFAAYEWQLIPIRDNDGETDDISRVSKVRKTDEVTHG